MGGWLSPDSKLYTGLAAVTETVIINVLLVLFSLPILTAGAAMTGAHRALLEQVRDEGSSPAKAFWAGFTSRFGRATMAWSAMIILLVAAVWEIWAISRMDLGIAGAAVTVIVMTGMILIAGLGVWLFPYLSETDVSLGEAVRCSALLAMGHLPRTLACLALLGIQPIILRLNIDALGMLVFANIIILPAAILYTHDLLVSGPLGSRRTDQNPPQ